MFNTGFLIVDLFSKGFEEPMQLKDQICSHCGYQEWLRNNGFYQQEKIYKLSQSFSLPNEGVARMK